MACSVNFSRFSLFCLKRFHVRLFFKPRVLCLICSHFEHPKNKYFCVIKIIFAINQFQTMQSLHLWKKNSGKNDFAFLRKIPFIY